MALQGTLDTFALPDVLRLLAATKKSGCLRLTGPRGAGSAWVDEGGVVAVEASHAPRATEVVDALFELLRFEEGSFTFDPDVLHGGPGAPQDVEVVLDAADALLREWREIESIVPSMDAWVRLRRELDGPVSVDPASWTTLVAVGTGATVAAIADRLELAELPVSRAVRGLVQLGVIELTESAPAAAEDPLEPAGSTAPRVITDSAPVAPEAVEPEGSATAEVAASELAVVPAVETNLPDADAPDAPEPAEPEPAPWSIDLSVAPAAPLSDFAGAEDDAAAEDAPLPFAAPIRARRARGVSRLGDEEPREPQRFVPMELPGSSHGSYDAPVPGGEVGPEGMAAGVDDLAASFPGLASRPLATAPDGQDGQRDQEELARQLATFSPRAAEAVRAAAEATTDEEREAAIEAAADGDEQPISRGVLLKFLSSVKS